MLADSELTRISDADSDVTSLELAAIESKSLLQSIQCCEFCVTKTLRLHFQLVFDDSDICAFAAAEEIRDISYSCIE